MPKQQEPASWLSVVIRVALDWRFLLALAVLARILLSRSVPGGVRLPGLSTTSSFFQIAP
jgi:hypothetical protein